MTTGGELYAKLFAKRNQLREEKKGTLQRACRSEVGPTLSDVHVYLPVCHQGCDMSSHRKTGSID